MAFFSTYHVAMKGIASCVPKNKSFNSDLSIFADSEREKLIATLGIETRRIAPKTICASDMCLVAAEKLIADLKWKKEDIELLIFVSQTPDYILPGTSSQLVCKLGLSENCVSYDLNQGCAGYVYGLSMACNILSSSKLKKGLLLIGDTITKLISPDDKSTVPLFSDAGTATALEYDENAKPIFFDIKTMGKDYESIIVKGGAAKANFNTSPPIMAMKGMEVFQFSISKVNPVIDELFDLSGVKHQEIEAYVFHQANQLILDMLMSKQKIDPCKVPTTLKNFGNTNGASIPLTASLHLKTVNGKVLLCGFGVGLSVAACILEISNLVCSELSEI
ncbi:MAG: ketoacyl-ACP synthase III [Bacteroidetes bacterium]|nr:ketoacyl-ACP synthase III [Bacteroidota bacterium]